MLTSVGPILIPRGNFEGFFFTLGACGILCCMMGAGNGGAKCHGIRGEVSFSLVVLSSRTLFGVVVSCGDGVEAEGPTLEHGVTDLIRNGSVSVSLKASAVIGVSNFSSAC